MTRTEVERIVHGAVEAGFPQVGMLRGTTPGTCAGTLVGPYTVITSASCIETAPPDGTPLFVLGGASAGAAPRELRVHSWTTHPDYLGRPRDARPDRAASHDIALVFLEEPVRDVVPAKVSNLYASEGLAVQIVGFGRTAHDGSDDGTKHARTGVVNHEIGNEFEVDVATCRDGDFGGPIITRLGRSPVLLGVTVMGNCVNMGIGTRLGAHWAWLQSASQGDFGVEGAAVPPSGTAGPHARQRGRGRPAASPSPEPSPSVEPAPEPSVEPAPAWSEPETEEPSTASSCEDALSCGGCTDRPGCGFCDGSCHAGDAYGPTDGTTCDETAWAWLTSECEAE